jgi:hypothetical protein
MVDGGSSPQLTGFVVSPAVGTPVRAGDATTVVGARVQLVEAEVAYHFIRDKLVKTGCTPPELSVVVATPADGTIVCRDPAGVTRPCCNQTKTAIPHDRHR